MPVYTGIKMPVYTDIVFVQVESVLKALVILAKKKQSDNDMAQTVPRNQSLPICVAVLYSPTMIDDLFENLHPWKLTWNIMEPAKITQVRKENHKSKPRKFGVPYFHCFQAVAAFHHNETCENRLTKFGLRILSPDPSILRHPKQTHKIGM